MLTKAYIKAVPEAGDNTYKVEVPLMEDNTQQEAVFDALLCSNGDTYNGYQVGDCVYVQFEDQYYNNAVIMGKLYTETPSESSSYTVVNELKVTNAATLPPNTNFGNYTAQDIYDLFNAAKIALAKNGLDIDDLKGYVKYVNTERVEEESSEELGKINDYYADKIRCMTGEEYDAMRAKEDTFDQEEFDQTLHFLTTPSPTEDENGDIS